MYSKTLNTLTALMAASLFLTSGWLFGHPVGTAIQGRDVGALRSSIGSDETRVTLGQAVLHGHRAIRMSLAMPYYSFSLTTSDRRAD